MCEKECFYTSEVKLEVQQHIAELIRDCSFMAEEKFRNVKVISVEDCVNIDGGLLADIVIYLPELRILKLRNSGVTQYNVVTMSRNCKQLLVLDATCDHFLYVNAYCVVANLKALRKFECNIYLPGTEYKDWQKLLAIFGSRVEFGRMMVRTIKFWSARMLAQAEFAVRREIEQ